MKPDIFDIPSLVNAYDQLELGWKIAAPILAALSLAVGLAISALVIWWAASWAGEEEFSYPRSLAVAALHSLLFTPISWVLLRYVFLPNAPQWGNVFPLVVAGTNFLLDT